MQGPAGIRQTRDKLGKTASGRARLAAVRGDAGSKAFLLIASKDFRDNVAYQKTDPSRALRPFADILRWATLSAVRHDGLSTAFDWEFEAGIFTFGNAMPMTPENRDHMLDRCRRIYWETDPKRLELWIR